MSNIAEVIGWKFDHQEGMSCGEDIEGNLIIKAFPNGIPSQADQDLWTAEYNDFVVQDKINHEARQYLTTTDWYLLRELEGGKAMTATMRAERAAARVRIL